MPKIIANLQTKLIETAKRQLDELGYEAVTIRSVAKECGVGVGTVYNYFPSKEALLATYMLQDWNVCIHAIRTVEETAENPKAVLQCMYQQLRAFSKLHQSVLYNEGAAGSFSGSVGRYHGMLREQLAAPLKKFCKDTFQAEFVAEAMLVWTMADKTFEEVYGVIGKLF